jgi:cytochrome c-type biogenesis protein CcmH/NrfG
MANLLLRTDQPSAALDLAREALSLEPDAEPNFVTLGKVWTRLNDFLNAIHSFENAVRLRPTGVAARYQLYRLYLKAGDPAAAEKQLAAYQEIVATYRTTDSR